jgi:hypothetical protein
MIRIILGVIIGFIAWTIIWLGSEQVLILSLDWYRDHSYAFQKAMFNKEPFDPSTTILCMNIIRGIIASVMTGFLTAIIAGENRRSPLILGIFLLIVGIYFEIVAWNYLPMWYHFAFLLLLIPATIVGGKLKKFSK